MKFEEDIKRHNIERINSIYCQFVQSDIRKADNAVIDVERVNIKGCDIKCSLKKELRLRRDKNTTLEGRLLSLQSLIGKLPQLPPSNYIPQGVNIEIHFNMYSYAQVFSEENNGKMGEYNNLLKLYIQQLLELKKLKLIIENIQDNQVFKIPVNLMKRLELE